jgi:hypothetical protein
MLLLQKEYSISKGSILNLLKLLNTTEIFYASFLQAWSLLNRYTNKINLVMKQNIIFF